MLVLFSLILRAVSLEFWEHDTAHRAWWEWAFVIGSALPALLFGVALANVLLGVPLNAAMEFTGDFFTLLQPFTIVVGLTGRHGLCDAGGRLRRRQDRWRGRRTGAGGAEARLDRLSGGLCPRRGCSAS